MRDVLRRIPGTALRDAPGRCAGSYATGAAPGDVPECSMSGAPLKCAKRTQSQKNPRSSWQGRRLRERLAQERGGMCQNVPSLPRAPEMCKTNPIPNNRSQPSAGPQVAGRARARFRASVIGGGGDTVSLRRGGRFLNRENNAPPATPIVPVPRR